MARAIRALGFTAAVLTGLGAAQTASAHHSFNATFDASRELELEGVVRAVRWQNPHVSFDLEITAGDEAGEVYDVETLAISGLRRRDITEAFVAPGDRIRVAGNPTRQPSNGLYLGNILLASGEEIVLQSGREPRFSEQLLGTTGATFATEGDGSRPELGLFRVWSTPSASPFPFPEDQVPERARDFALTDAARAAFESFDPVADNPIAGCTLKGMPTIMEQPYPMEFRRADNGDILLRLEEYDTVRRIRMSSDADPAERPATLLGFSQGRWEGNTLVVETTRLGWGWYDTVGIPLDENAELVERFTLAEDGSRLDWTMTITDPTTFTEPRTIEKYYLYVPGIEVRPFECTP